MQSYNKYKEYYDRKAKATPLKESDYCFVLQPKADHQRSQIRFRYYRWVGSFIFQKVLPNENYIVRRLNTNETQILHRIRLKKFVPNQPLEDYFREERLQQDEELVIPQDDLYTITWETTFTPVGYANVGYEQSVTPNTDFNDADDNEVDYILTNDGLNEVNDALRQRNER